MPADEVSIREMDGQGAFVVEMRINLWQKRMRVSGRVNVEFISRGIISPFVSSPDRSRLARSSLGRIWSLTFFSPPPTTRTAVGMWQIALCLLEHSPPTFIDSRLMIDLPPSPSNASQAGDLISLSPPPDDAGSSVAQSPPSNKSKPTSKAPEPIQVRLKSTHRLAYRASDTFLAALDIAFLSQKDWSPPHVEQWSDSGGSAYTNAIVVPLDNGSGAELLYE